MMYSKGPRTIRGIVVGLILAVGILWLPLIAVVVTAVVLAR